MIHQLECEAQHFEDIINNLKGFEVRKNDRDYKVNDFIGLNELTPDNKSYTERWTLVKISYIFSNTDFLKDGYVILGLTPCFIQENQGGSPIVFD